MYIPQKLYECVKKALIPNRVVVLYGPRQVGKTTLLRKILDNRKEKYLLLNGEARETQIHLSSQSIEKLKALVGQYELLAIDEAQAIANIGINLKLLVDHCPGLKIIVTGSSSLDLAQQVGEPLVGRKKTFKLFPLSQMEIGATENSVQTEARLEERLIYGTYPQVVLRQDNKERQSYLHELITSALYKDILAVEGIRKSKCLTRLLQLLAFQIGKEISLSELGQQLSLNKVTVGNYLDLLEQCFVIVGIGGFNRNLRKEVSKQPRYYFYDLGVRNAIINQFNPLEMRDDIGELWENYLIIERLKKQAYLALFHNNYFWRTYDQQEIDWVEEYEGKLHGYEFKWREQTAKVPSAWKKHYSDAGFTTIHRGNYLDFIT